MPPINIALKTALMEKRMSQGELAKKINRSNSSITRYITGKATPSPKIAVQIAAILDKPIFKIFPPHPKKAKKPHQKSPYPKKRPLSTPPAPPPMPAPEMPSPIPKDVIFHATVQTDAATTQTLLLLLMTKLNAIVEYLEKDRRS